MYLVNRKAVIVLERHTHTVLVRYVKSGKVSSVSKKVLKYWKPKEKPQKQIIKNQTKLKL